MSVRNRFSDCKTVILVILALLILLVIAFCIDRILPPHPISLLHGEPVLLFCRTLFCTANGTLPLTFPLERGTM